MAEKLKFYDLRGKKSFTSSNYDIKKRMVKGTSRRFAVADAPSGIKSWRVMKKA